MSKTDEPNKANEVALICKRVSYFAPYDEDAFFEWIKKIKAITHFEGWRDELYLFVDRSKLTIVELREILALFYRYRINMRQLKKLIKTDNKHWLDDPDAYWHPYIFGNGRLSKI